MISDEKVQGKLDETTNMLNMINKIDFYEELFGLCVITRLEGNVIMSEGLVLQDIDVWYDSTKIHTTPHNNMTELEGGQKLVRFCDPSVNLIEERIPVNHN